MRNVSIVLFAFVVNACNSNLKNEQELSFPEAEPEKIIGERIDGPANVREQAEGENLFELFDNTLIEVASKSENDWYQIVVFADINYQEAGIDSMLKGRPIIVDNDTIGRILKTHEVSIGTYGNKAFAILTGYTHKNNIKPTSIIEKAFENHLLKKERSVASYKSFILSFNLDTNAFGNSDYLSFYKHENAVDDPSPGFRLVLLFEKEECIGFVHSRAIHSSETSTYTLKRDYLLTFFEDYPKDKQNQLVNFLNEWFVGVD